jgi:hypothetical protein
VLLTFCKPFAIVSPPVNALPSPNARGSARSGIGLLLLLLFLGMELLALFPCLHHAAHEDSGAGHHVCAVTLLESGRVEPGGDSVQVAVVPLAILEFSSRQESSPFISNPVLPGVPERGPPSLAATRSVPA